MKRIKSKTVTIPSEIANIDKHTLDDEFENHPRTMLVYATKLADANLKLRQAEAQYEETKAEVASAMRTNPTDYGLKDKPSEASIDRELPRDEEIKESHRLVLDCQHKVDLLKAAVNVLRDKKGCLEELAKLHTAAYYGEPKSP